MFILYTFLISLGINLLFFIFAYTFKSDKFTDITYSLSFILIALILMIWNQAYSWFQISIFIITTLWAIRLGSYLLIRIMKTKVDHRFDNMRDHFWKFLGFWLLQATSVFLIIIPAAFCFSYNNDYFNEFNYYSMIPLAIALLGLIYETVADIQKYKFKNKYPKDFINIGLWKQSRHPNYFGEIIFWYSVCTAIILNMLLNVSNQSITNTNDLLWTLSLFLSPLYIQMLLIFLSGVPLLEKSTYKKYGSSKDYENYVKHTSCVIPYFGKKGHILIVKNKIKIIDDIKNK
ncbi:DUF1295 domain-containing protein [Spiroplasma endosymbiont of Amphibalanus improvisus]|uniref:DUF1295 domain-containing protein n=1 Tax=Spiroplasma endosymbiont of Amphibalanus improvisus TaxID=3066327 RepID=UPI00313F05B2